MKYHPIKTLLAMFFVLLIFSVFAAQAATPQETLNQYISDLQKNPNDNALREKIIKHVQTMKPKPAIPAEAERYEGRAEFAIKNAKSKPAFLDAAKEYEKALLVAPWASAYYFNQGVAYEKGGILKKAKNSFEFYLLAEPNAQDARDVRKRIAGLEYAAEKAAKESSPEAVASREQNKFAEWLRKIDGRRYSLPGERGFTNVIDIKGKVLVSGVTGPYGYSGGGRFEIRGREFSNPLRNQTTGAVEEAYVISEEGDRITYRVRYNDGDVREWIYLWQK